ncbi:MAG: hypothetical protein MUF49_21090 [Oculatellaceae cyanobacterium Prado106]|nr:hypothetical protein [Oculatellaceae cyanobacterium Prado106]
MNRTVIRESPFTVSHLSISIYSRNLSRTDDDSICDHSSPTTIRLYAPNPIRS